MSEKRVQAKIVGTGTALPEKVLTNFDLEKMVDTSDEWIRTRTGILSRRIASEKESTSDLAILASQRALENANCQPQDIDLIVVATCTPDYPLFPSVGCLIQRALQAKAPAMDVSAACSGFIYGLASAKSFIESGAAKRVLLVGGDTLSKAINWKDRTTCILFGDGAGAAVLEATAEPDSGILSLTLGSDGNFADILSVPAGGSRQPMVATAIQEQLSTIHMDGPEVYKHAVTKMPEAALSAIEKAGVKIEDIRLVIPHQANLRIIESVAKRLKLREDQLFVNVQKYGNMSSATTIIALDEAQRSGRVQKGDLVVLVAFGAGLTWGAAVVRW